MVTHAAGRGRIRARRVRARTAGQSHAVPSQAMQMAGRQRRAHDPEAQAWYVAQVGELHLRMGQLADAEREYRRAAFLFPELPVRDDRTGQGDGAARRPGGSAGDIPRSSSRARRRSTSPRESATSTPKAATLPRPNATISSAEELAGPGIAQTEAASGALSGRARSKAAGGREDCRNRGRARATTSSRRMRWRGRTTRPAGWTKPSPPRSGASDGHARRAHPGARRGDPRGESEVLARSTRRTAKLANFI